MKVAALAVFAWGMAAYIFVGAQGAGAEVEADAARATAEDAAEPEGRGSITP